MAVVKSFELNGNKKSFSNWISNLSPQLTPFTSMIGKEKVDEVQYSWQTDHLAPASLDTFEEGSDAEAQRRATTHEFTNFTSILRRVAVVSDTAQEVDQYGKNSEIQYQISKAVKELKRDLEFMNLHNVIGNPSVGNLPGKFFGFEGMCAPFGVVDPDTGAITHHKFSYEDPRKNHFNIDAIYAVTMNLYLANSKADKIMFHPRHAKVFSDLLGDCPETPLVYRMFDGMEDKFNLRVSKIRDPLGRWYTLIPNRYMPEDKVFFYNESDWDQMILREPSVKKLGKFGSSERYMVEMEVGLRHRHLFASGVLTLVEGLTAVAHVAPTSGAVGANANAVATVRLDNLPVENYLTIWNTDNPDVVEFPRGNTKLTNVSGVASVQIKGKAEGEAHVWCSVKGIQSNKVKYTVTAPVPPAP